MIPTKIFRCIVLHPDANKVLQLLHIACIDKKIKNVVFTWYKTLFIKLKKKIHILQNTVYKKVKNCAEKMIFPIKNYRKKYYLTTV